MANSNIVPTLSSEALGEDIPKETLISLLKDKSKELKIMSSKLGKVEEKYVKIFKEHKNLLKDKDNLERFLCKYIFSEPPYQLQPSNEYGIHDYDKLCELWNQKEEDKNQSMANIMSLINKEKSELEMKYKSLQEKQTNEQLFITQMNSLKEQVNFHEENNSKLSKEILELNELLAKKNEEMLNYKKIEQEFSQYKAEILLKELSAKNNKNEMLDVKARIKENEKTNEILRLRQELERSNEIIKKLESINISLPSKEIKPLPKPELLPKSVQTEENGNNNIGLFKKKSIEPAMLTKIMNQMEDSQNLMHVGSGFSSEKINHEYLKNVLLKFFIYLEGKNYNEASILMQVILTIMKMTKEEKKLIEDAREKATLWNSAKNYLSDTFFYTKNKEINYQVSPHLIKKNGINGK